MRASRSWWLLAALVVVAVAAALRFVELGDRPPHHDEGVNGWLVDRSLEKGYYAYDHARYHGPLHFYLQMGWQRLLGRGLWEMRALVGLCSVLLVAAPLLLRRRLGAGAAIAAAALLAVTPTVVYYGRYNIHETLLVLAMSLVVIASLRALDSGRLRWVVAAIVAASAMLTTKETAGLFLAPWALVIAIELRRGGPLVERWRGLRHRWLVIVGLTATAAAIYVAFYTGFLRDGRGPGGALWESIRAYGAWAGEGSKSGHEKPWSYYLLTAARYDLPMIVLGAIGTCVGFRRREVRVPGILGLVLLAGYSAIPYKTPWLAMNWIVLLAIPAGYTIVRAAELRHPARIPALVAMAALVGLLAARTARVSFLSPASEGEALAYVHTTADYNEWYPWLLRAGEVYGAQRLRVHVDHDAPWPLPWSLEGRGVVSWGHPEIGRLDMLIVSDERASIDHQRLRGSFLRKRFRFRASAKDVVIYVDERRIGPLIDPATRATMERITIGEPVAAVDR